MSWPYGVWNIKTAGCDLSAGDRLKTLSTGAVEKQVGGLGPWLPWGSGFSPSGNTGTVTADGQTHTLNYDGTKKVTCVVSLSSSAARSNQSAGLRGHVAGRRRPEGHNHIHPDGHTGGGTGTTWTAEEG